MSGKVELHFQIFIGDTAVKHPEYVGAKVPIRRITFNEQHVNDYKIIAGNMVYEVCDQALRFLKKDGLAIQPLTLKFQVDAFRNGRWNRQNNEISATYDSIYHDHTFSFLNGSEYFYALLYALAQQTLPDAPHTVALEKRHQTGDTPAPPKQGESDGYQ